MGWPFFWSGVWLVLALQRRTIVAWLGGAGRVGIVTRPACAAQGGLAGFAVVRFTLVLNPRQARFDVVEFRGGDHVLRSRRKQRGNFLLRRLNAVRSLGMRRKCLGNQVRLGLLQVFQLLKDGYEGLWIVARAVHVLHTQKIGLGLKATGERQKGDRYANLCRLVDAVPGPS